MHWIIIGVTFAIVVALNLTQWPRKKLARLQDLAEADFEKRQTETVEAAPVCGEYAQRFSMDATPRKKETTQFGVIFIYFFEVTYRAGSGELFLLRFNSDENAGIIRGHLADLVADPDQGFDEEDRRLLADVFLTRAFQQFYDKLQLHPLAGQKITFSKSTTNDTNHTNGEAA